MATTQELTLLLNSLTEMYYEKFATKQMMLRDLMPEIYLAHKKYFQYNLNVQSTIDFTKHKILIDSYMKNIDRWAKAKTYKMTNEIVDGVRKGVAKETILNSVTSRYNEQYLDAEIRSFGSTIENTNNFYNVQSDEQMLEYSTANDEKVRDSHRALDGLRMKKSDPRWKYLYPPPQASPWNCRCRVVPVEGIPSQNVDERVDNFASDQKMSVSEVKNTEHPIWSGEMFSEKKGYFDKTPKWVYKKKM